MFLSESVVTEASILKTPCHCADRQLLFLSETIVTEVSNLKTPCHCADMRLLLLAESIVTEVSIFKDIVAVTLVDHTEMHKTDCFGETRLVLHVPSSS